METGPGKPAPSLIPIEMPESQKPLWHKVAFYFFHFLEMEPGSWVAPTV